MIAGGRAPPDAPLFGMNNAATSAFWAAIHPGARYTGRAGGSAWEACRGTLVGWTIEPRTIAMGGTKATIGTAGASNSAAIEGKLESARRNLLDMSFRNRLLNFRTHRQTGPENATAADGQTKTPVRRRVDRRSLAIIGAAPAEIYELLVDDEKTLEFSAADDAPDQSRAGLVGDAKTAGADHSADDPELKANKKPPTLTRDKPRLPTPLTDDQLDTRLLFLAREAESALQVQGFNILYLALWTARLGRSGVG